MRVLVPLPAASGPLFTRPGCLLMHSARETSGTTAAAFRLYDGASAGGKLMLTVGLAASASDAENWTRCVLPFSTGLYFDLVSGAVEGAVSVLADHDCDEHVKVVLLESLPMSGG